MTDAAQACAKGIRDRALATRLLGARSSLQGNNLTLKGRIANHEMHLITKADYAVAGLSSEEMKWLYTGQFSKLGRPGRMLYQKIIDSAPGGLCCYCQYGVAKTLDHFVPQDHVATLAIDPWNLVPACEQCNHTLRARWGTSAATQMLHPYAMPDLGRWLRATVTSHDPIELRFVVNSSHDSESDLCKRMHYEFESLGLADLYSIVSAGDVVIAARTLSRTFAPGNGASVQDHLLETAGDAFAVEENSRRGVVLEALAGDTWFCAGGYAGPI